MLPCTFFSKASKIQEPCSDPDVVRSKTQAKQSKDAAPPGTIPRTGARASAAFPSSFEDSIEETAGLVAPGRDSRPPGSAPSSSTVMDLVALHLDSVSWPLRPRAPIPSHLAERLCRPPAKGAVRQLHYCSLAAVRAPSSRQSGTSVSSDHASSAPCRGQRKARPLLPASVSVARACTLRSGRRVPAAAGKICPRKAQTRAP